MNDPRTVIAHHLDAVRTGDPDAMAADYAPDAVLVRPDGTHRGHAAILAYFRTVPDRLGGGQVAFGEATVAGVIASIPWRIDGGPADGTSGTDTCQVHDGRITLQQVDLTSHDF